MPTSSGKYFMIPEYIEIWLKLMAAFKVMLEESIKKNIIKRALFVTYSKKITSNTQNIIYLVVLFKKSVFILCIFF